MQYSVSLDVLHKDILKKVIWFLNERSGCHLVSKTFHFSVIELLQEQEPLEALIDSCKRGCWIDFKLCIRNCPDDLALYLSYPQNSGYPCYLVCKYLRFNLISECLNPETLPWALAGAYKSGDKELIGQLYDWTIAHNIIISREDAGYCLVGVCKTGNYDLYRCIMILKPTGLKDAIYTVSKAAGNPTKSNIGHYKILFDILENSFAKPKSFFQHSLEGACESGSWLLFKLLFSLGEQYHVITQIKWNKVIWGLIRQTKYRGDDKLYKSVIHYSRLNLDWDLLIKSAYSRYSLHTLKWLVCDACRVGFICKKIIPLPSLTVKTPLKKLERMGFVVES